MHTISEFKDRHPSTLSLLQYFSWEHLPAPLQDVSKPMGEVAFEMVLRLPDGPELSTGLRKLLEAKDCFVRAALPVADEN